MIYQDKEKRRLTPAENKQGVNLPSKFRYLVGY